MTHSAHAIPEQRVLVLGGGGFIGRHTMDALHAAPWAMPVAAGRRRRAGLASFVPCNALDAHSLDQALRGMDCAVSLICGRNADMVAGTGNLLRLARMHGLRRVVLLSSMAVYQARGCVNETGLRVRPGIHSYAAAKVGCEILAERAVQDGMDVVTLRPSCVYGPGSVFWTGCVGRLLRNGRLGDLGKRGQGVCNLIHAADLARMIVLALHKPGLCGEVFNASSSLGLRWNTYLQGFAQAIDTPLRHVGPARLQFEKLVAGPVLKGLALVGQRLKMHNALQPDVMSPTFIRTLSGDLQLDCNKAQAVLPVRHTALHDGLQDAAHWFVAEERRRKMRRKPWRTAAHA